MNENHPDNTPDTSANDPWESEMSDEFERRVRDLHEAPLDLNHVKGKAMKIHRKRQGLVAAGAVAVAAAIVPFALVVSHGSDSDDGLDPAIPPSQTVVDTPSDGPTDAPSDGPTTPVTPPDDVSDGFDFITAGDGNAVLHESDGGVIELPRPDYTDAADLGGRIAAYRAGDNASGFVDGFVDIIEDGEVVTTYDARSQMVITPTSSAVAFMQTKATMLVVNVDTVTTFGAGFGPYDYVAAIIGDGDCGLESGCHPFLNDGSTQNAPYEINYEGPNTDVVPGAVRLNDANDDFLASIQISYSDTGSCGGLYDRRAQEFRFKTCESQVLNISPQGDYVVGTDPYGDGIGPGYFSILDGSTGKEVARYAPERGFINRMAWADDTHAVATVFDGASWSIVSLDATTGESATLVGPVDGSAEDPEYLLTGLG